jgi:hypothetical protein
MTLDHALKLIATYFNIAAGTHIPEHLEKIELGSISTPDHPHTGSSITITRRALKHFTERRYEQLTRSHSTEHARALTTFALMHVLETISTYDEYTETTKPCVTYTFTKDYSALGHPRLRVVLEKEANVLEIVSIHFTKRTKKATTE